MLKGFIRNIRPLEILTEEQVQAIHSGTLNVLETTGVRVEHDKALELFADHGCKVDTKEKRVRIPSYLAEDCLRRCPSVFKIRARDPKDDLMVGGNRMYYSQGAGMDYLDLDTWESRRATLQEHDESMIVADAIDSLHLLMGWEFYMDMVDIPPCMITLEGLASGIRNSTKAEVFGYGNDSEKFAIKMAKAVGMDLHHTMYPVPPLTIYGDICDSAFSCAEAGFSMCVLGGTMFGGTGPVTIAGSLVSYNADIMASIVLMQLLKPGTGVTAWSFVHPLDMRSGYPVFGAVESRLFDVAFHQIWRKYGIPTGNVPGYSNSKKIDFQNGYERGMATLINAAAGAHIQEFQGAVSMELTHSPVMAVLDNDITGWIGRLIEGIQVTNETLGIDLINEVGPIPGSYLTTEHTREWWKKEQFRPKVADRECYPEWIKGGKKDALALAKAKVEEILATHKPKPLTLEESKAIDEVLKEARSYYVQKGLM